MKTLYIIPNAKTENPEVVDTSKKINLTEARRKQKTKKMLRRIVRDALILLFTFVLLLTFRLWQSATLKNAVMSNLVAGHYDANSAFLEYEFTPRLKAAIEDKDIDLYGIYAETYPDENGFGCTLVASDDADENTIQKIEVSDCKYVKYSQEYREKYFYNYEFADDGYWLYTIDLVD